MLIRHRPSGISAEANERRSQQENQMVATGRLQLRLALAIRTERHADTVPSPLWREASHGGRLPVGRSNRRLPALLAEALDVIAARQWDVAAAADELGCTTSQLVKLLKLEPAALTLVNGQRIERGLGRLK